VPANNLLKEGVTQITIDYKISYLPSTLSSCSGHWLVICGAWHRGSTGRNLC